MIGSIHYLAIYCLVAVHVVAYLFWNRKTGSNGATHTPSSPVADKPRFQPSSSSSRPSPPSAPAVASAPTGPEAWQLLSELPFATTMILPPEMRSRNRPPVSRWSRQQVERKRTNDLLPFSNCEKLAPGLTCRLRYDVDSAGPFYVLADKYFRLPSGIEILTGYIDSTTRLSLDTLSEPESFLIHSQLHLLPASHRLQLQLLQVRQVVEALSICQNRMRYLVD